MSELKYRGKGSGVLLWRGLTKACPLCGKRKLFRRWVHIVKNCPRCGLKFERIEGHWIGAVGINTIISFTLLFFALACFFLLTYPNVPIGSWVFFASGLFGLFPLIFYPNSKTLWTAIDILMRPIVREDMTAMQFIDDESLLD